MNHPKPKVIILSGYGLNCEDETKFAFELAGGNADIVHINDLVESPKKLKNYQILVVPGGFSYGDDTGSGKAYANKLRNHLEEYLQKFIQSDKLVIGICNGFQILTQARLLPGALTTNTSARYLDRWVDLGVKNQSPWLKNIKSLTIPIAHGEGNYYADKQTLNALQKSNSIALKYINGEACALQNLKPNPNGSLQNIAGVTAYNGRVLGLMPHPERAIFFTQLPHWTLLKEQLIRAGKQLPQFGPGLEIFKNAISYFS